MKKASALLLSQHSNTLILRFEGAWTKEAVASLEKSFLRLPLQSSLSYQFDFSEIEAFDTHGIMLILHYLHRLKSLSASITLLHKDEHFQKLFEICDTHFPKEELAREFNDEIATLVESVTKIGNGAFYKCESLECVDIPANVTEIEDSAFYGCTRLAEINLSASLLRIGNRSFYNCTRLNSIILPHSLTYVDSQAFGYCENLNAIYYEGSLEEWSSVFTYEEFPNNISESIICYYSETNPTDKLHIYWSYVDGKWMPTGKYIKYPKNSSCQNWCKKASSARVRKYMDLPHKGNSYRRVFDYWWTLY